MFPGFCLVWWLNSMPLSTMGQAGVCEGSTKGNTLCLISVTFEHFESRGGRNEKWEGNVRAKRNHLERQ